MAGYIILFIITEVLIWDLLSKSIQTIREAIMARNYNNYLKKIDEHLKNINNEEKLNEEEKE